ncbi:MAG TPA: hypothetical protein VGM86_30985 [Thermoanaerobaculia bacterium]
MKIKFFDLLLVLSICLLALSCGRGVGERASATPQNNPPEPQVVAEEAEFFMAGTEMRLGMLEKPLIAKLKENYLLSNAGEHGWVVLEKTGPPYKMVGSVGFTNGRLSSISKEWGSYSGDEAQNLGKDLFSLLSTLADKKSATIVVNSKISVRQPGITISEIELLYPNRTVSIAVTESRQYGNSVVINEMLKAK